MSVQPYLNDTSLSSCPSETLLSIRMSKSSQRRTVKAFFVSIPVVATRATRATGLRLNSTHAVM